MPTNNRGKTSNYNSKRSGKTHRGNFRKKKKEHSYVNTKGYWEWNEDKRKEGSCIEEKHKQTLAAKGGFDPHNAQSYINPPKPITTLIQEKKDKGGKLKSGERIVLNNHNEKQEKLMAKDLQSLKEQGLYAIVNTIEGRHRKLILSLEYLIKKGDHKRVALIYLKLKDDKFQLSDKLKHEYSTILKEMEQIVSSLDIVKLQMTELHSSQPPLCDKGFTKLDAWQIQVIENIDNGINTIVPAPTSSGKSIISIYPINKKGVKVLVVVPTDVLAWQHCAYYTKYLKTNVPLLTKSFKTSPKRDELVKIINSSDVLVGTADEILNFLPLIKVDYDWVIFDEIHMMGKPEGSSMEHIARLYSHKKFLALSATIGNVDELKGWFQNIGYSDVSVVGCNKRFFNLQRYAFLPEESELVAIHPLGMVTNTDFEDKSVLEKSLQPTPPNIWDFAIKLSKVFDLKDLEPYTYFNKDCRITLDMSNEYFSNLLKRCVEQYKGKNIAKINSLIDSYHQIELKTEDTDLLKLIQTLKKLEKCPAIIFQPNSTSCMRLVRGLAKQIENAEEAEPSYKKTIRDRAKAIKKAKKIEKSNEKLKLTDVPENKKIKMLLKENPPELEVPDVVPLQEPHEKYVFNNEQLFTAAQVDEWAQDLKKYFPNNGDSYHWLIIMLWRGIGVYVTGLPDNYLRLVQRLASTKQLSIVFSDNSLVFGVSMPFRTTVLYRDVYTPDTLDPMMYHQMAGRAGRRGLDTQGNVVFAGYSFERITDLSVSAVPKIQGIDTMVYSIEVGKALAKASDNNLNFDNMKVNFFNKKITNEASTEFYSDISENISEDGGWGFLINSDRNHQFMIWQLRDDIDCVTAPMIIQEFAKLFDTVNPNIIKHQIAAALFMSHFIHVREADSKKYVLSECVHLKSGNASKLKEYAENLGIDIPENIDSRVFHSITRNRLLDTGNEAENDELRSRLRDFSDKIITMQHYLFHSKKITVTRLLGKLLTRIWWIYHTSSPLMKSTNIFELDITEDSDEKEIEYGSSEEDEYEDSSGEDEDEDKDSSEVSVEDV